MIFLCQEMFKVLQGNRFKTKGEQNYAPCFIDGNGRECAVAHLLILSGQVELANNIATFANYAYVPEMNFPELGIWAKQTGFSKEELALIQPGYWQSFTGWLLVPSLVLWTIGLISTGINILRIRQKQHGIILPITTIWVSIFLLLLATFCLRESAYAYHLGTHADGYPHDLPLRDVVPLLVGGLISLILAIVASGVGFYRVWGYIRIGHKRD